MRKFIISDIHGNGNLYYSVIGYIENISKNEDVTLFINGDLIDRGIEAGEILLDVISRMNNKDNPFKIVYLGGNHELMMYQCIKSGLNKEFSDWYANGGWVTYYSLEDRLSDEEILKVVDFISNLDLYCKFEEKIDGKNIVLCHAACPLNVNDTCDLKIKDDDKSVEHLVWARKNDPFMPFRTRIGNKDYFSIVGHTPNIDEFGYVYDKEENSINIDGGSAMYVCGFFNNNHFPLVEVKDDYLKILTFNSNNEIIHGNYFKDYKSILFTEEELNIERGFLNHNLVPKKLVELDDGIIGYEEWKTLKK